MYRCCYNLDCVSCFAITADWPWRRVIWLPSTGHNFVVPDQHCLALPSASAGLGSLCWGWLWWHILTTSLMDGNSFHLSFLLVSMISILLHGFIPLTLSACTVSPVETFLSQKGKYHRLSFFYFGNGYLHFSHLLGLIWALSEVLKLWCRDTVSPTLWIWAALQKDLSHEMLIWSLHCHFKPIKEAKCTTCHIQFMHRECVYESICFPAWKPDGLLVVSCFLAKTCPCFWSGWSWWCPQPLLMTI